MTTVHKRTFLVTILLLIGYIATAQQADTLSARVYFHRAMYDIDLEYQHNGAALWDFVSGFQSLYGSDPGSFEYIMIRTGCSPEGGIQYNRELAFNRARTIRDYLIAHLGLKSSQIRIDPVGIDWSGLKEEMAKQYFPGRWDMFAIMDRYGVKSSYDRGDEAACQIEMIRDRGGEPWRWMSQNIFPKLRAGSGQISVVLKDQEPEAAERQENGPCNMGRCQGHKPQNDTIVIIHKDTIYVMGSCCAFGNRPGLYSQRSYIREPAAPLNPERAARISQRDSLLKVPVMAFRSNLLLPAMNLGVEVPIGNRWSVAADWYYPWVWRPWMNAVYPDQKNCAQLLGGYLEARYWFGGRHTPSLENRKYRLSGHSLALIGAGGYYDYGHDWTGRQGEFMALGLDYMYSLILGRGKLHLDFDIALGYFQMQYRNYEVYEEGGKLFGDLQQFHFNSVVPVKAGVSLVIPIFQTEKAVSDDEY